MNTAFLFVTLFGFMLIGMPIAISLGLSSVLTILLQPESAATLDSLGWVHLRLGRHSRALALLREAWAREKDAEIAAHLGEALWIAGEAGEARAIWKAGTLLDPDNAALRRAMERYPE